MEDGGRLTDDAKRAEYSYNIFEDAWVVCETLILNADADVV